MHKCLFVVRDWVQTLGANLFDTMDVSIVGIEEVMLSVKKIIA